MKFRWTMKDLEKSDAYLLRGLVSERLSELTPYTPLAKRLGEIHDKLTKELKGKETP